MTRGWQNKQIGCEFKTILSGHLFILHRLVRIGNSFAITYITYDTGRKQSENMNLRSKIILWAINLMACADPGIIYNLSRQENLMPLLVYRMAFPLVWGTLWAAFSSTFKSSAWNRETRKKARIMMLSMLVINVLAFSVALGQWGSLASYSLILMGMYLGKILV